MVLTLLACLPAWAEEATDAWFSIESKRELHQRAEPASQTGQERKAKERAEPEIYQTRQGKMAGAFGILFESPLQPEWIQKEVGWVKPPPLPEEIHYYGPYEYKQFRIQLRPPDVPVLFKQMPVRFEYSAYVDFDRNPVWIRAETRFVSCERRIAALLEILNRKYEPSPSESGLHRFTDGTNLLQVACLGNRFSMDYFDLDGFDTYMKIRNLPLMTKIDRYQLAKLTQIETYIAEMARNLNPTDERSIALGFGIPFGKPYEGHYVPDQLSPFQPPNPLKAMAAYSPVYEILVSPQGLPIRINSTIEVEESAVKQLKWELDEALQLIFGGFLKRSRLHTVVSSTDRMIAVRLTGDNRLSISFIDSTENKAASKRESQRQIVSKAREADRIRRKQMKQEKGF